MDRRAPEILKFGRFALDSGRGCLREGPNDVDLRPKTFQVLRYLAANAGSLVPKQDLYDAIWPNVAVTDDSLVQCIRELRVKLGDDAHRLIKTVPRRGYLLDAPVVAVAPEADGAEPERPPRELHARQVRNWGLWSSAGAGVLAIALGTGYVTGVLPSPQRLFTTAKAGAYDRFREADERRIAEIADRKQLPLPQFRIGKPLDEVPQAARRFIGVWVSDTGWTVSHRQIMLIVTDVGTDGSATGYVVHGPPQPLSHAQSPAHSSRFQARVLAGSLTYSDGSGDHSASFTEHDRIQFTTTFRDGTPALVSLEPVWTLLDAERIALSN